MAEYKWALWLISKDGVCKQGCKRCRGYHKWVSPSVNQDYLDNCMVGVGKMYVAYVYGAERDATKLITKLKKKEKEEKAGLVPLIKKKGFYITCDWYSDSGGEYLVEELKLAGFESKYKYEHWNERDGEFDGGYIYYPNVKEADEIVCGVTGADYMSDFKDWEYKTKDEINKENK